MRIGMEKMIQGRFLYLLLAVSIALSWASPLRAEGPPRPVGYYVDLALLAYPSLASMRQRIEMKRNEAIRAGALDDPKAWIGLVNVPTNTWSLSEEDMTGKEVGLSQMFPFPGSAITPCRSLRGKRSRRSSSWKRFGTCCARM